MLCGRKNQYPLDFHPSSFSGVDRFDRRARGGEVRPDRGPPDHQPRARAGHGVQQTLQVPGNHHSAEKGREKINFLAKKIILKSSSLLFKSVV